MADRAPSVAMSWTVKKGILIKCSREFYLMSWHYIPVTRRASSRTNWEFLSLGVAVLLQRIHFKIALFFTITQIVVDDDEIWLIELINQRGGGMLQQKLLKFTRIIRQL